MSEMHRTVVDPATLAALTRADVIAGQHRVLFEECPCGVLFVARDGTILRVNRAFSEIVGYAGGELELRRTVSEITIPADSEVDATMAQEVSDGKSPGYRMRKGYITKSDEIITVELDVRPVKDGTGQIVHLVGFARRLDIDPKFLRVERDRDGKLVTRPTISVFDFLRDNWPSVKWTLRAGVAAATVGFGTAVATVRTHFQALARLDVQSQQIEVSNRLQEEQRQDLRKAADDRARLEARLAALTDELRVARPR